MGMENNFEKPNIEARNEEITFPHGEYGIKEYEKEYGSNPEEIKKVREIFDTFLNLEIENVQVYKSEKFGISFPYTRIDMNSFTKKLYEKSTGKKAETKKSENNSELVRREFIFPGAPLKGDLTDNGPLHFAGESMHQCIGKLPSALEKIKNGEEAEPFEVLMLGTPVNKLGTMSPEFMENFKKDPTGAMSAVFAEFIEKDIVKNNKDAKLDIELYGISWGGSLSAITGEKLLETGSFTQEVGQLKDKGVPKITIKAQNPISLSRSQMKGPQVWLGSPLNDKVSGDKYGPTMGKENPEFMKKINNALAKRGILPNISEQQKKMKKKAITDVVLSFRKGVKLKPETKVTEIYGLEDLTTKSASLTREVKEQKETHGETLGQNLAIHQRENSRVFGVETFHEIPWFRENELKRIRKAVEKLEELKN